MGRQPVSRYDVDKFIVFVEASDEEVRAYTADPAEYVESWIAAGNASRVPVANGGRLSADERTALASVDYGTLYEMGAHPYVLWHFAEAVLVWEGNLTWPELKEEYREAVRQFGTADFAT